MVVGEGEDGEGERMVRGRGRAGLGGPVIWGRGGAGRRGVKGGEHTSGGCGGCTACFLPRARAPLTAPAIAALSDH